MDYFVLPLDLLSALHFNITDHNAGTLEAGYYSADLEGLPEVVVRGAAEISGKSVKSSP